MAMKQFQHLKQVATLSLRAGQQRCSVCHIQPQYQMKMSSIANFSIRNYARKVQRKYNDEEESEDQDVQEEQPQNQDTQTIFVPNKELKFDEKGRIMLYSCRNQVRKLKKMTYIPIPVIGFFAYCIGSNIFVAHSIFKTLLWSIPFIITVGFRRNIVTNAQVIIDTIYLLEGGTKVEIMNVYGDRKSYEIKHMRRPNQQELNQFKIAGGQAAVAIMQDYFPILIDTRGPMMVEGEYRMPQDMIFIDRNGEKIEPELVNAVLNGLEIDTESVMGQSKRNNKDSNTIDI